MELARAKGWCEVKECVNTTPDDIYNVFQDPEYRDRIALFHYGGHAHRDWLQLESPSGGSSLAHREGLSQLLARLHSLKMVFLNGCSTGEFARDLAQKGIPMVAGTSEGIDDRVATGLAQRFYQGLGHGLTLERSWLDAVSFCTRGTETDGFRDYYRRGIEDPPDCFPWKMYFRNGAEGAGGTENAGSEEGYEVKNWTLPGAVNDFLFGVPPIPRDAPLPENPYLLVNRYQREHAALFFGRSFAIRQLYDFITKDHMPPVVLLYGQSGVGKSSLLEAGLIPRLGNSFTLVHARRNRERGLKGTLQDALDELLEEIKPDDAPAKDSLTIAEKWKRIESGKEKNLVVILDQAEEAFTLANGQISAELEEFRRALQSLFGGPPGRTDKPAGKLVLGYRKEYHPEMEEILQSIQLGRSPLFLKPLEREEIIEVVKGLTLTPRLKNRYHLEIEPGLPGLIAGDLLEDPNSPVAPVLQILLTRMWDGARPDDLSPQRCFTINLYRELKKEGLLVSDFLRRQMEEVREVCPEAVDSGLALDLLMFFTTALGTARARRMEEVHRRYRHHDGIVSPLVQGFTDLYLLADPRRGKDEAVLVHDTFAPVVIREYNQSDKPGQRAARLLAAKMRDWDKKHLRSYLDDADLNTVIQGQKGMRALTPEEKQLLEQSCKRQTVRERKMARLKIVQVLLLVFLLVAMFSWQVASYKETSAEANNLASQALASEANDPVEALRLAKQARDLRRNFATNYAIHKIFRENNFHTLLANTPRNASCVAFAPRGTHIFRGYKDGTATMRQVKGGNIVSESFPKHKAAIHSAAFSPSGQTLLTGSRDGTARLWGLEGNLMALLDGHESSIGQVSFSPGGLKVLTVSASTARVWNISGELLQEFESPDGRMTAAAFLTGIGTLSFLTGDDMGNIYKWRLGYKRSKLFSAASSPLHTLDVFRPGDYVLAGYEDHHIRLWGPEKQLLETFKGSQGVIIKAVFSADGSGILSAAEGDIRFWPWRGKPLREFYIGNYAVDAVTFNLNGQRLLIGSEDGRVCLWDIRGSGSKVFSGSQTKVSSVVFLTGGRIGYSKIYALTADASLGTWNPQGKYTRVIGAAKKVAYAVAFSPGLDSVLSGGKDGTVCLRDTRRGSPRTIKAHDSSIYATAFSYDGKKFLTGDEDGLVRLWSLKGKRLHEFRGHTKLVSALAFSPKGSYIVTAAYDNTLRLWNGKGKELRRLIGHGGYVFAVTFSPDGKYILTGSADKTARLWDLEGNQLQCFRGHGDLVGAVAFSPDGKRVLTGSRDGTARLWKIHSLEDFLKRHAWENPGENLPANKNI